MVQVRIRMGLHTFLHQNRRLRTMKIPTIHLSSIDMTCQRMLG